MPPSQKRPRSRRNEPPKRKVKPPPPEVFKNVPASDGTHPILFLLFLVAGLCLFVALISYTDKQNFFFAESFLSSFAGQGSLTEHNWCGALGATVAVLAFNFFGAGAFLLPFFACLLAYYMLRSRAHFSLYWKCTLMFFLLCAGTLLLTLIPDSAYGYHPEQSNIASMPQGPGGCLGELLLNDVCEPVFGTVGTACLTGIFYIFCLLSLLVASPQRIFVWCVSHLSRAFSQWREEARARKAARLRMLEARRQNAAALRAQERAERIAAGGPDIPAPAGAPQADHLPPVRERSPESPENDFSKIPVHVTAVPEFANISLPTLDKKPEVPANESEQADASDASALPEEPGSEPEAPEKILGTLTPFPHPESEPATAPEPPPGEPEQDVPEIVEAPEKPDPIPPASVRKILGESAPQTAPAPENTEKPALQIIEDEGLERADDAEMYSRGEYIFPPLSLLKAPTEEKISEASYEEFKQRGEQIVDALSKFKISSELTTVQVGPTITRYEITPQDDVRVEKILGLQNNIAMKIKVQSARLALVPEHGTVGIEVPNKKPKAVFIREILESKAWHENQMEIPIVLGKDVTGKPVIMDLAKMPHGLIAGSTGSGKSVCINGLVTSILYSASPEDVRLVMVDPKAVELDVYNRAPHMLIPVITDAKKVPGAIKWLINEMERRYEMLRSAGVRNIVGFNAKLIKDREEAAAARERAAALEKELSASERAAINEKPEISVPRDRGVLDELAEKKKMPYIVCIVDEFSDLMQVAGAEIESGIARLAAKARAAGIHLILATQRPDAKTVTGLIKANLPSRIAFKVTSAVNSKIILDEIGAESLIGKGDMLYLPPGTSVMSRAQGSFVSDNEISDIVDFLHTRNGPPHYAQEVQDAIDRAALEAEAEKNGKNSGMDDLDLDDDEALMMKAWEIIRTTKRASTSSLQVKMRIGYGRATRIMDMLEERGYIGPPQSGSKTRDILVDD